MKIFSRFPVFRVVIPFSAGIICVIKSEVSPVTLTAIASSGMLLSFLFTIRNYASGKYAQRWLAGIPFYCCFWGLGGSLTWIHQSVHYKNHFQEMATTGSFLVELENEPAKTKSGLRFIAAVQGVNGNGNWLPARGNLLVYLNDTLHSFTGNVGNKMVISGAAKRIEGPSNPNAFDARNFYAGKGAWHQMYVAAGDFEQLNTPAQKTAFTYARMLRDEMLSKLKRHLGEEELGVAGALLLGFEDWLDPELENYWSGAGVLHVLCVSGMHVMLIYVILAGLLGWMEKHTALRHLRYVLLLMLIWFYAMVTGFSPSVIRAAAMISFVIAGNWIHREASIYNLLCSSCMLMFVINPYLIMSAGFQLSFLAVCGIIFLHKMILPIWVAPNKFLHKIWELISVSLAAQLSTFPLSLFLFHQFPNYFLIGNLLIIPLSTAVMYSGLTLLVTDWIPYAGLVSGTITSYGIWALNHLVIIIGKLPGALTKEVYLGLTEVLIMYSLLIFVPVWVIYKSRSWLFICLLLISVLCTTRIYHLCKCVNRVEFTVYNSKACTVISLINGRNATLITDSLITSQSLKFSAGEHLIANMSGITSNKIIRSGELLEVKGFIPQTIYILKDWKKKQELSENLIVKRNCLLIIGGHLSVDAKELVNMFHPSMVIFDSSIKGYGVKKLESVLHESGIPTYAVREKGAFQYP